MWAGMSDHAAVGRATFAIGMPVRPVGGRTDEMLQETASADTIKYGISVGVLRLMVVDKTALITGKLGGALRNRK
jgi:hypothetical protein